MPCLCQTFSNDYICIVGSVVECSPATRAASLIADDDDDDALLLIASDDLPRNDGVAIAEFSDLALDNKG